MATRRNFPKFLRQKAALRANPNDLTVSTVSSGIGNCSGFGRKVGDGCVSDSRTLPFGVLSGAKKRGRGRPRKKNKVIHETSITQESVEKIKGIGISACPQCQVEFDGVSCSPIQEACGHIKCRVCFIQSLGKGDNYCQQCELNNGGEIDSERNVGNKQIEQTEKRTKQLISITANVDGANKQHSIQKKAILFLSPLPLPAPNSSPVRVTNNNKNTQKSSLASRVEDDVEHNLSSTKDDSSAAACNSVNVNTTKDSLKVTLQIQSKDEHGNASLVRIKNPKSKKNNRKLKRNPVNLPDHVITIQPHPESPVKYKCTRCEKSFKTKAHGYYHAFCMGADGDGMVSLEKPFKCDQCDNAFVAKSHYEYHLRTHTGERPYSCDICGKGFNQRGKVTRHMRSHTGEKPFVCQQCGRGFANAQALRSHFLIHTGERPFACQYCNKRFTGMTNLKKHVITHTGERPFSCSYCSKSFGLKWTLDLHVRTHSTDRPFACDKCPRAFSNNKDLRRHLIIHTAERPWKCTICGTAFRRKDNLDRHVKTVHSYQIRQMLSTAEEASNPLLDTTKTRSSRMKTRVVKYTTGDVNSAQMNATSYTEASVTEAETPEITTCKVFMPQNESESEELSPTSQSHLPGEVISDVKDTHNACKVNDLEVSLIKREVSEAETIVEDLVRAGLCPTAENKNISRQISGPESQVIHEIFIKQEQEVVDRDEDSESNSCDSKKTVTLVVEEDGSTHLVL